MPLKSASEALYRGHPGATLPAASKTKTCAPLREVFVVVATTSIRPSRSRSPAAIPRVSGHCPPLHVEARHLTRMAPSYAATVPSLPPTTISLAPSPSRSATTPGAYTRPSVAVPLPSRRPRWS